MIKFLQLTTILEDLDSTFDTNKVISVIAKLNLMTTAQLRYSQSVKMRRSTLNGQQIKYKHDKQVVCQTPHLSLPAEGGNVMYVTQPSDVQVPLDVLVDILLYITQMVGVHFESPPNIRLPAGENDSTDRIYARSKKSFAALMDWRANL